MSPAQKATAGATVGTSPAATNENLAELRSELDPELRSGTTTASGRLSGATRIEAPAGASPGVALQDDISSSIQARAALARGQVLPLCVLDQLSEITMRVPVGEGRAIALEYGIYRLL